MRLVIAMIYLALHPVLQQPTQQEKMLLRMTFPPMKKWELLLHQ